MWFLEIAMLAIGLGAVVYSFRMSDSQDVEETGSELVQMPEVGLSEAAMRDLNDLCETKTEEIEQKAQELIDRADDTLSELSNEKIMGMSEYSDQVLDKIEKNHAEAVFLYDMLNEKQEEIKKLVHDVDRMKADFHDEMAQEYQKWEQQKEELEALSFELPQPDTAFNELLADGSEQAEPTNASVYDAEIARIEEEESRQGAADADKKAAKESEPQNRNDEIISLYKKGNSILDISKMLSMGQGEVKFVIDLYNAR